MHRSDMDNETLERLRAEQEKLTEETFTLTLLNQTRVEIAILKGMTEQPLNPLRRPSPGRQSKTMESGRFRPILPDYSAAFAAFVAFLFNIACLAAIASSITSRFIPATASTAYLLWKVTVLLLLMSLCGGVIVRITDAR